MWSSKRGDPWRFGRTPDDTFVRLTRERRHGTLVELRRGPLPGRFAEARAQVGVIDEAAHGRPEGTGILGRCQEQLGLVLTDLSATPDIGQHERPATGRCLHRGPREALAMGGEDEDVEGRIDGGHVDLLVDELDRTEIFTHLYFYPEITVRPAAGEDAAATEKRIHRALAAAQKYSLVANSVKSEIVVEPTIVVIDE